MIGRVPRQRTQKQQNVRGRDTDDEEKRTFSHHMTDLSVSPGITPLITPIDVRLQNRKSIPNNRYKQDDQGVTTSAYQRYKHRMSAFDSTDLHKLVDLSEIPQTQKILDNIQQSQDYSDRLQHIRRPKRRQQIRLIDRSTRSRTQARQNPQIYEPIAETQNIQRKPRKLSKSSNLLSYNYEHSSLEDLWRTIPKQISLRSQENLRYFAYRSYKMNPLFKKLEYITVVEILKCCRMQIVDRNDMIYSPDRRPNSSYIILWGKVALIDELSKKQSEYEIGQTLHEDYLLEYRRYEIKALSQSAVAVQSTGLLELTHKNLILIKTELLEIGLKSDLQMLESEFRKNYLTKLSLRSTYQARKHKKYDFY